MSGAYQSGESRASEPQKCFVAHSYQAEWHDTIEAVCDELLPKYGLQPWYAEYNYDPTPTTLLDKIISMIDNAPYGLYDLSYWRINDRSPWIMPCNVLIELGIAIALNRPTILLRHTGNRIAKIELPKSIQSVTQICEFTGGDYSLERNLREHLSRQANLPTDYHWHHHRCHFGETNCTYLQVYPRTAVIGDDKLHCYIADGPDTDQLDFRYVVEAALGKFSNISYSYLDKRNVLKGYTFLLCSHCQLIRSTPFSIYRLTPETSSDTYIAIGISIGLEYRFRYKIPRLMITKDMENVPSLLRGYPCVLIKNLQALKKCLPQFVQQVIIKIDEPACWKPSMWPSEAHIPFQSEIVASEDTIQDTPLVVEHEDIEEIDGDVPVKPEILAEQEKLQKNEGTDWMMRSTSECIGELEELSKKILDQIIAKVNILTHDPRPDGNVKKHLKHIDQRLYRLRCGDYRIFYTFEYPWISLLAVRRRNEDTYSPHILSSLLLDNVQQYFLTWPDPDEE